MRLLLDLLQDFGRHIDRQAGWPMVSALPPRHWSSRPGLRLIKGRTPIRGQLNFAKELGRIRNAQDSGFTLPLIIRCRGEHAMPNNIIWWVGAIVIVLIILGYIGFR
jgi:hypothetical protein